MSELAALNSILMQLKEHGFHSSAIATNFDGKTEYLAWYKMDAFVEDSHRLRHLAAMVRKMHDDDLELKAELTLGEPDKRIVNVAGITFRHLSLEEQVQFNEGYSSPQQHFDKTAFYDHSNGRLVS